MFLCCGEALIDMMPRLTAAGTPCFEPHVGGSVLNTAVALGRLGTPSGYFSGMGRDFFGDMLRERLAGSNVDFAWAKLSDQPTTLAFVRLVNGHASYAFYDESSAARMLGPEDLPDPGPGVAGLFFGSISLAALPGADTYAGFLAREADRRLIFIDPNIRQGFIRDEAGYRARLGRMLARADVVKLSDEDLVWLEGAGDLPTLARGLLARGPKAVFVTEGARGASAYWAGGTLSLPAPAVSVADTVGAGDTFNAGIMSALWRAGAASKAAVAAMTPELAGAALDLGIRAAAVTVSRPGANPPWEHEL